jgi:hypothetical protein
MGRGKPSGFSKAAEIASTPEKACFHGRLESRHRIDDGSEYLHFVFGGQNAAQSKPACRNVGVIDAEFIFLAGNHPEFLIIEGHCQQFFRI